ALSSGVARHRRPDGGTVARAGEPVPARGVGPAGAELRAHGLVLLAGGQGGALLAGHGGPPRDDRLLPVAVRPVRGLGCSRSPRPHAARPPDELPAGRPADEGRHRDHGEWPGGPLALPRSSPGGVRGPTAERAQAPPWERQTRASPGHRGPPSGGAARPAEDGVRRADLPLVSRRAAVLSPRRGALGHRGWPGILPPRSGEGAGGRAPGGAPRPQRAPVGPPHPRALVPAVSRRGRTPRIIFGLTFSRGSA